MRCSPFCTFSGMGKLVYDNREDLRSKILVHVEPDGQASSIVMSKMESGDGAVASRLASKPDTTTLRRRKGGKNVGETGDSGNQQGGDANGAAANIHNSFVAIPSAELREAIKCFRSTVDHAIELVNATKKVENMFTMRSDKPE